ncbi:acriflavin resistance protein [Magnetococcus marinus MC-1]|uniref:Acriflavin resistance protein n=1 Tax=Magnetococcus marinus (strain ATCC BAA-1437 / JCM 17883 / MC-1) TaxID=156889 RepID=A0L6A6_MAGMM|nr:efflux RND transporter permease subunit [Magnetococcus marinus]ABK43499.1 acriflavin resistance protein [Magnetococcus marinus MC-1]
MSERLGLSGSVAKKFQNSEITPLLAIVGFLLGLFAIAVTPQEEEPQISVTFANVFIPYPGASAAEVEQTVTVPAEQVLSEVSGVKHVYSFSRDGMAVLTVRYRVGEDQNAAILRLYNAIFSNENFLPQGLGVGKPLVKPMGIDDVPILSFTLWSDDPAINGYELTQVAHSVEAELKGIEGTRKVYTVADVERVVNVQLDPVRLAGYGLTMEGLAKSLMGANRHGLSGTFVEGNQAIPVYAGDFLSSAEEIADLVVAQHEGRLVHLSDVADVELGPDTPSSYGWFATGPSAWIKGIEKSGRYQSVTIAVSKKEGLNAVSISKAVIAKMDNLKGYLIPDNVQVTLTRDYGATAEAKANKLIGKLGFATAFVVLLVLLTMGWREALIVGVAVLLTLALTLFGNWAWGFTLNRVSLFALIFSIGILVDDAIVVVENIHRHMHGSTKKLLDIIPKAVDEVGGPTILATFTVIAALLPMAFVTGLMGPYMSPIPINASTGMLISLVVAFVVTPWLTYKGLNGVHNKHLAAHAGAAVAHEDDAPPTEEVSSGMLKLFRGIYGPFVTSKVAWFNRTVLALVMIGLIAASLYLVVNGSVILKMLPFDNKSEFQVVVDMPEGTTTEGTAAVMEALGAYLITVPEVTDIQSYVGTASPVGFNGLVRQFYLRKGPNVGDIQINLVDKHHRERKSHDVARAVRQPLQEIGAKYGANVKIVEVPPGPPVQSPLVVEVYGPNYVTQIEYAQQIEKLFHATPDIVDIDTSVESPAKRMQIRVDRKRAAQLGVDAGSVINVIQSALEGKNATYLHVTDAKQAIPVRISLHDDWKHSVDNLMALKLDSHLGQQVPLTEVVQISYGKINPVIHHKNLKRVVYVTGDMAGAKDSPLYGLMEIDSAMGQMRAQGGQAMERFFIKQPSMTAEISTKWDGEWQITYETFRDMGIAYGIGLLMIYLLVVAQFRSYVVPIVIMMPIPLTVIGVMPGHAIMGAQFTATSMIGMIALAGIIVRNSILLVDFINEETSAGLPFAEAVIHAGAVRSKPILLTGFAAILGALFILDDPIFSGLAISLIFGIFVSTMLTLIVIPVTYYSVMNKRFAAQATA